MLMHRILYCGSFLISRNRLQPVLYCRKSSKMSSASSMVKPKLLAKAWAPSILEVEEMESSSPSSSQQVLRAMEKTIPLLQEGAASVPFVCRYRADVVDPLTTRQCHLLQTFLSKHASLASLRAKILDKVSTDGTASEGETSSIITTIQTSISKTELEDIYAPFKPPSKGSILERIQSKHPELVEAIDKLWSGMSDDISLSRLVKTYSRTDVVHLLGGKIAAEPIIAQVVVSELEKHCRIKTTTSISPTSKSDSSSDKNNNNAKTTTTYKNYDNFSTHLKWIKDHQTLAIRRGMSQKAVKMGFEIDSSKMEGCIRYHLMKNNNTAQSSGSNNNTSLAPQGLKKHQALLNESIHDAWTRLLRRRGTNRVWNDKCKLAEERAFQVFQDNLHRALLAPPRMPSQPLLALDPGFQAGIKCAILDSSGAVIKLKTLKFLGNRRDNAIQDLIVLLTATRQLQDDLDDKILVALGNGHGSQECRKLVHDASKQSNISVEIELVNEAGASVWSVTESASQEFPDEVPAAIASISIGRRLQNPLFELVKIPPKSLGLGQYQHDLSEKELDERLHIISVDAVATVGVDVNSCSLAILQKVPGLNRLAGKIIKARPLQKRSDLLGISGLGPKTFENSAGFLRVNGNEPLDGTLVHPESYELARWLLNKLSWRLDGQGLDVENIVSLRSEWGTKWEKLITRGSQKFHVSNDRILNVLGNIVDSMTNLDPRLNVIDSKVSTESETLHAGSIKNCSLLPQELLEIEKLASVAPVRSIVGTIRNVVDFGAFVDFGGKSDGLLHTSKLGSLQLSNLLIGQQIGVDILSVENGKVSLGVSGLNLQPEKFKKSQHHRERPKQKVSGGKRSMSTKSSSSKRSRKK